MQRVMRAAVLAAIAWGATIGLVMLVFDGILRAVGAPGIFEVGVF